jgi:hypothetical protein
VLLDKVLVDVDQEVMMSTTVRVSLFFENVRGSTVVLCHSARIQSPGCQIGFWRRANREDENSASDFK